MMQSDQICMKVKEALIEASTTYKENQKAAYYKAVCSETIPRAKWALEKILENSTVAEQNAVSLV